MSVHRIQHVVIIVKENHCFDNYFGTLHGVNGMTMPRSPNPPPKDPDHSHAAWLARHSNPVLAQFVEQDIPAYFAYARQFTLCDNYFTDVAGPSTPNHLMLVAADSPVIGNPPNYRRGSHQPMFKLPSLPANLEHAKLTWGNYGGYVFDFIHGLAGRNKHPSEQFKQDALAGKLPTVSWLYAPHDASEHPPNPQDKGDPVVGNVTHGMQWTVDQVNAIVKGGLWPKCAIFITWDDWGGWFDHADPPEVEKWTDGSQFRYGSRVPCLVLSPYAKRGHISNALHSHVSLIRFCEITFRLPDVNKRTAGADPMSDCFDFSKPAGPPPV
ncbi:MAG TPA: alkaline phosphatase family protein [Burkholderiales bacterium]|nr:alkaline phosphatase family protein [Burkholderiales bacterium]